MTDAHSVRLHFDIVQTYPQHEPRESDVHYTTFNATRRRLKRLGALKCWIGNADCSPGPIELHHSTVEFSLANVVDTAKFAAAYPEFHVESDEDFLTWVNSEGNLLPLCVQHHRGVLGIHSIHYPGWLIQRVMRDGVTPPERKV